MLRTVLSLFAVVALAQCVPGQPPVEPLSVETREPEIDAIETDRSGFTPSTRTVAPSRLLLESAYTYSNYRNRLDGHSYPELLFRYGANERIELRLGWNYEAGSATGLLTGEERREYESNLNLGTKLRVTEQDGWIPESSLILTALVPTSGPETSTLIVATYAFGWELPRKAKLDAAFRWGSGVEEGDHFSDWAPSIVLKVPLGEKWNVHAEYFGIFTSDKAHDEVLHYFSPGIHYLVNPDLEIGVRLGWGLNNQSARFFTNVGLGYRF